MPYYPPSNGSTVVTNTVPASKKVNAQVVNAYSLQASDVSSLITLDNALPIVVTIPVDSALNVPVGTVIELMQLGPGRVSVEAPGVTLKSAENHSKLKAQYSQATLLKTAPNVWVLTGDLAL